MAVYTFAVSAYTLSTRCEGQGRTFLDWNWGVLLMMRVPGRL
jgi:hypothetical protein